MKMPLTRIVYLSYFIDENTPTYGNKSKFKIAKKSSITSGDSANESELTTNVHIGTHLDMPLHFYEDGQSIEDFTADFWFFNKPLFVEIVPNSIIIKDELIDKLKSIKEKDFDIVIIKTGICERRETAAYWETNYGLDPAIHTYLRTYYKNVRVIGFDSISISSFKERDVGREAHRVFLNKDKPILILEDLNLRSLHSDINMVSVIIAPMLIRKCDGLPCTVFGIIDDK